MIYPITGSIGLKGTVSEMERLQSQMSRLFGSALMERDKYPLINAQADKHKMTVLAQLPGFQAEEINIEVKDHVLTIEGERKAPEYDGTSRIHRAERGSGHFLRSIAAPYEIEADQVEASYQNGLLSIKLPRAEASKPRKIAIQAN